MLFSKSPLSGEELPFLLGNVLSDACIVSKWTRDGGGSEKVEPESSFELHSRKSGSTG